MRPTDNPVVALIVSDPARRRRLARRAGLEAVRRGLRGDFEFHIEGTAVVASMHSIELARLDPWEDAAHD